MPAQTYILTSITVPPASRDLTELDTVKDDWGITGSDLDSFLSRAISRCSAAAANFCNREFGIATYQVTVRLEQGYRDGYLSLGRCNPFMLPCWPIAAISALSEKNSNGVVVPLVENTDFEVKRDSGMLYRLDRYQRPTDWSPTMTILVTVVAGYVLPGQSRTGLPASALDLPPDIQDAVGRMVYGRYSARRRDPLVKAEEVVGVSRTEYIVGTPGNEDGANLPPDVADILNNYRQVLAG